LLQKNFFAPPFRFGKAKSAMLKIVSSDSSAEFDAVVSFWKAFRSSQTSQLMNIR